MVKQDLVVYLLLLQILPVPLYLGSPWLPDLDDDLSNRDHYNVLQLLQRFAPCESEAETAPASQVLRAPLLVREAMQWVTRWPHVVTESTIGCPCPPHSCMFRVRRWDATHRLYLQA